MSAARGVSQHVIVDKGKDNSITFDNDKIIFDGAMAGSISVEGNNNSIFIGDFCKFNKTRIFLKGNNSRIVIGANCFFDVNKIVVQGNNCAITIGDRYKANSGTLILAKENDVSVTFGVDCLLSTDVSIRTSDAHGIFDGETKQRINPAKSIVIGDRVWIGENVKILKGVCVNSDSIIGAASTVTKDVPSFCVVAGTPARLIRKGVFWYKHFTLPAGYDPFAAEQVAWPKEKLGFGEG